MRIATWNVNSLAVRLPQVLDWLAANPVDILALQELKLADEKFPIDALRAAGYEAQYFGQRSYNGVALLARLPATAVQRNIPGFADAAARVIAASYPWPDAAGGTGAAPRAAVRVVCGYMPNGQAPGSEKFEYKLAWFRALRDWLREELGEQSRLVLLGDFNITFDDRDVWDPVGLAGQLHCTEAEREQLQALLALGLHDAFRLFEQPPKSYSWWDYRELGFRRNRGLRIDHILVSERLRDCVRACLIDRAPRANERPSDHAPVLLELAEGGCNGTS